MHVVPSAIWSYVMFGPEQFGRLPDPEKKEPFILGGEMLISQYSFPTEPIPIVQHTVCGAVAVTP